MKTQGKVKFYHKNDDYGNISGNNGVTYKFKLKDILNKASLSAGDTVSFNFYKNNRNTLYAKEIEKDYWENNQNQQTSDIINNISNWSQEAKKEEVNYFYTIEELDDLKNGNKNFVIGRKGTGKTAICEYMNLPKSNKFSVKLSFKNFPFNELYKQEDSSFRRPNQYISLWKYIIYVSIVKMMQKNENINLEVRNKLDKVFNNDIENSLSKTIKTWTSGKLDFKVLGTGFSTSADKKIIENNLDWIERIDILEEFIHNNIDNHSYYILFDELDEDYIGKEEPEYFNLLTGLFKAIMQIRDHEHNNSIIPIAFLRNDIYLHMINPDKHKWEERITELNWNADSIQKMLAYRISIACGKDNLNFKEALEQLFTNTTINHYHKKYNIYDFIASRTLGRPRDYVYLLKQSAIKAKSNKTTKISTNDIDYALLELSKHIKQTLIDEIYPVCNNINLIFKFLSKQGKYHFSLDEFKEGYALYCERHNIVSNKNIENILELLYSFGIIGNYISDEQLIFYRDNEDTELKLSNRLVIHKSLTKILKIIN